MTTSRQSSATHEPFGDHANPERSGSGPFLIETRDLTVSYGAMVALDSVSFGAERHRVTALVGPSGCGKTSLLNCLNRMSDLIPGCSIRGSVRLGEVEVFDRATDTVALRRRVGMIFQRPNPFPLTIRKNVELAVREHGVRDRRRLDEIVEGSLRDVGLWDEVKDRLNAPARVLSGGQQQRLCLARAIALEPEVLLLDEPCSALDPISSGVVEDLISSFRGRFTVLVVTHNLAQARRIADSVAVFWVRDGAGRLVELGSAEQIFSAPRDPVTAAYVNGIRG